MSRWFAVAVGRGTALKAVVDGPYKDAQALHAANQNVYGTFQVVGNQSGYPTHAQAQAEADRYNKENVNQKVTQAGGNTADSIGNAIQALNPLSGIDRISRVLELFWLNVSDPKMWRSLAWILLGALLFVGGIVLWLKGSVTNTVAGLL